MIAFFVRSALNALGIGFSLAGQVAMKGRLSRSSAVRKYSPSTFGRISEVEMGHFDFVVVKVDVPAYSRGSEPLVKVVIQIVPKTLQG